MIKRQASDKAAMWLYYWRLLAPTMPEPVAEYHFDVELGRKHRFDYAYVEHKIAVEINGGSHSPHGGKHATDRDREKLNIAAALKWRVFCFSPQQLINDPDYCVALVVYSMAGLPIETIFSNRTDAKEKIAEYLG